VTETTRTWTRQLPFTAIIANGATVSTIEIDLSGRHVVGLMMPTAWTTADIAFDLSLDSGANWYPIHDKDGAEIKLTVAASRYVAIPPALLPGLGRIRLRSSQAQGAERSLTLIVRAYA
jgi:hypothetical protein